MSDIDSLIERLVLESAPEETSDEKRAKRRAEREERIKNVQSAIQMNVSVLNKHGLMPVKALGRGSNGVAFLLRDGRVMKITTDKNEAQASYRMQGRKSKNVVSVDQTFRLKNTDVYGIVQEKLVPLSEAERRLLGHAFEVLDHFIEDLPEGYKVYGSGWDNFQKKLSGLSDDTYSTSDVMSALRTLSRFKIPQMVDELHSRGIMFFDYHVNNVMKRPYGSYIITDLGVSTVFNGIDPMPIESVNVLEAEEEKPIPGESTAFEDELLNNKDLLIKNNIRPIKFIANGSRGEAYLCANGQVLKVTMDRAEAVTSMHVMGKNIPGVVRISRVFAFPGEYGFYGILQEKLTPLSVAERKKLDSANRVIENVLKPYGGVAAYRNGWQKFVEKVMKVLERIGADESEQLYHTVISCLHVYSEFDLDKMMDGLSKAGVKFHDYHTGNIMKRSSGEYVITDLGQSEATGGGDIPMLEGQLAESVSDVVSVVYADLRPFNAKQASFIRSLARKGKTVILLKGGSIPFENMREVIQSSIIDVEPSVELFDASSGGDLPEIFARVAAESPSIRPNVAITMYSDDPDTSAEPARVRDYMVISKPLPAGIGPTTPPKDKAAAVKQLDPHVFSDRSRTHAVLSSLGISESIESILESILVEKYLSDIGGVEGAMSVISHNMDALRRRLNIEGTRFLGAGEHGAVFDIGKNRVLKITSDIKDVSSAMKLKGRRLDHVVTIHDVFQMKPPDGISINVYGVVADKVETLTSDEMNRFNDAFSYVRDSKDSNRLFSLLASNKIDEFFDALRDDLQKEELENLSGTSLARREKILAKLPKLVEDRVQMIWDRLREFKLLDMVEELSSNGVLYADYKGDNLGKRNGEYVVLDVGGKSDDTTTPPKLEGVGRVNEEDERKGTGVIRAYRGSVGFKGLSITHSGGSDYGPGLYFATNVEDTRPFGPTVTTWDLTVNNPIHVLKNEDPNLTKKLQKALRIEDEFVTGGWHDLMGITSEIVQIGGPSWAKIMNYLKKLGYDGIYVHGPKDAKGDYVAIFDVAQAKRVTDDTTGPKEGFNQMGRPNLARVPGSTQRTDWSSGGHPVPPSNMTVTGSAGSQEDQEKSMRAELEYIVKGAIGGLLGK